MEGILVIGDLMIDHYLIGGVQRVSPEAPVPVVHISEEKSVLGGAGNVVNNLLAFGSKVDIISVLGDGENAPMLHNLLKEKSISTDYITIEKDRPITKKTRILSSNQQIVRYDKETTKDINKVSADAVFEICKTIIKDYGILILSDYGKGVLTDELTIKIIKLAKKENIKVLVDPKGSDYFKYSGAYLLTPNKKEASIATGFDMDSHLLEGIRKLKSSYGLAISIITLNQDGIAVFDDKLRVFPTYAKEVYDVTGAGDTVIAAIGHKLAAKSSIDEAVEFANLAAGVVVGKTGVATVTLDEIYPQQHNIKTKEEIGIIATQAKHQNKKIVFTNGCFDILHLGHIKYLEKAKALGDILIVGVNSDDSVKRIKGNQRPINPEFDRAYILNALKSVDYTVLFNEDTPYELIKTIKPHVLVKGADYHNKEVVGSDIAESVKLIDFVDSKSTTEMIKRIKQ